MSKPFLLFLEDESESQAPIIKAATKMGYEVGVTETVETALRCCQQHPDVAVAIVDLRIRPDKDFTAGWDFLEQAKLSSETQVIVFTGHPDRSTVESLKRDPPKNIDTSYLLLRKNGDEARVFEVLEQQLARHRAKQTGGIVFESKDDLQQNADLPMIAASGLPVLITGPSGCGKEYIAQKLAKLALPVSQHHRIHTVNCAALTENIAIATLFGYSPGAYTGANPRGDPGILRRITGSPDRTLKTRGRTAHAGLPGILVLDELAELPPFVQAQLLRMMEGQAINPLGDSGEGYTPLIRIIACTNDESKLSDGFRKDLLGRLEGWHLATGSPRDRRATSIEIAETAARSFSMTLEFGKPPIKISDVAADVSAEVAAKLDTHEFLFGFRELKGWIGRACALALYREKNDTQLTASDLRAAWDRRMKLDDTVKKSIEKDEAIPVPVPREQKVVEVRSQFEKIMYDQGPAKDGWDEKDLQSIARRLKKESPEAYLGLVDLKKRYTSEITRQHLLYLAINGTETNKQGLRRFVDRIRKFLGATKLQ